MHFLRRYMRLWSLIAMFGVGIAGSSMASAQGSPTEAQSAIAACPENDSGLKLPAGFCATIFADGIGHARHLVVAPNGVVYVNTWSGRYYGNDTPHAGGFLVALQDTTGSGQGECRTNASVRPCRAAARAVPASACTRAACSPRSTIRSCAIALPAGSIVPQGPAVPIVTGLPLGGDHPMHPFAIDTRRLPVHRRGHRDQCLPGAKSHAAIAGHRLRARNSRRAAASGAMTRTRRTRHSRRPSASPPASAMPRDSRSMPPTASSSRSTDAISCTRIGRNCTNPRRRPRNRPKSCCSLKQGGDYGWPECYYDAIQGKLVLAPEYGGDGGKKVGPCATKSAPIAAFPAHWAPNAMALYDKQQFPAHYRHGVFIAFHGSWDRAPYPQGGYNVVFQALAGDHASGQCEIFADGFAGAVKSPGQAAASSIRRRGRTRRRALSSPMMCADGSTASSIEADQALTAQRCEVHALSQRIGIPPATISADDAKPPEGTHPDAGAAAATASLPVPAGATKEMVALGDRIYHGQVGGATCTGCHGADAKGTPLGPDLTGTQWLWGDGSYPAIAKIITTGVPQPKQYRSPMPPMGGAQLTSDQVSAVAAYIWALSHRSASPSSSAN